jgi:hypothetical protein
MLKISEDQDVYVSLRNFTRPDEELDFEDFKIFKVEQGREAASWRKKLSSKHVSEWMLNKKFPNYIIEDDDITGSDNISKNLGQLLLLFRLFQLGDLIFSDFVIKTPRNPGGSITPTA